MHTINALSLALFILTSGLAQSADSILDANLAASTGSMNSSTGKNIEGSINFDFQDSFGIQLDGLYSEIDNVDFTGLGVQVFFSGNDTSSFGVGGGIMFGDYLNSYEVGLQGEYYMGNLTLGAKAGLVSIEYERTFNFIDSDRKGAYGQIYANYYPVEDLLISASIENRFDQMLYSLNFEYDLPVQGLSIFASAAKGEYGYDQALVGARYYFGAYENLQQRQRGNGFRSLLNGILSGVGNYGAKFNHKAITAGVSDGGTFGSHWITFGSDDRFIDFDFSVIPVGE